MTRPFTRPALVCGALLSLTALAPAAPVRADDEPFAHFWSHDGNLGFLALGVGLPLLTDGARGKTLSLRTLDAMVTSTAFSEGLKAITREKRPETNERNSFPSGHATAAFAVATMQSHFHPRQAALWYTGATLIAASRVRLRRHYVHDVLAGAALGYGVARWEISAPRGLILSPFIPRDEKRAVGLQFSATF